MAPIALGLVAVGCGLGGWFAATEWLLPITAFIAAAGVGSGFVTAATTALGETIPERAGVISGIVNTFHEFGSAVGIASLSGVAAATVGGLATGLTGLAVAALVAGAIGAAAIPSGRPAAGTPNFMH